MDYQIQIRKPIREDGDLTYSEAEHEVTFPYSWGGPDVGIAIPSEGEWDAKLPWASGRREQILSSIALKFIQSECTPDPISYNFRITDLFLWVVKSSA